MLEPMRPCPCCGGGPDVSRWAKPIPIRGFDVEIFCEDTCEDDLTPTSYGATRAEAAARWDDYAAEGG